jgi:hypothetical protein
MRKAVLYLRVSTLDQTTANQERELREIAGRMGCEIVRVYKDHGISGTRGRDKRPAFDKLCRDAARREFDDFARKESVCRADAEPDRLAPLTPPAPMGLRGVCIVSHAAWSLWAMSGSKYGQERRCV